MRKYKIKRKNNYKVLFMTIVIYILFSSIGYSYLATKMTHVFSGCTNLLTIYASDKFDLNNFDLNSYVEETQTTLSTSEELDQTSMNSRLNQIYKEELEKDITQKVEGKGYEVESCKVVAHISQEDSGIEKITLKINGKANENEDKEENSSTIEDKIVTEIQKIQKVDINIAKNEENKDDKEEVTNITKTDIKMIKDFLINEYGVSEKCLKIS